MRTQNSVIIEMLSFTCPALYAKSTSESPFYQALLLLYEHDTNIILLVFVALTSVRIISIHRLKVPYKDPYENGQLQHIRCLLLEEIEAIRDYEQKLNEFEHTSFGTSCSPSSRKPYQQSSEEEAHRIFVGQLRSGDELPAFGKPPQQRSVPKGKPRPPRVQSAAKAPERTPKVRNAAPKVDCRRAPPSGRCKKASEQDPWEAWDGQDKELAANLANDIMDSSPGVKWDNIAGLTEAKRILQVSS
jgi:hypothetical protein